MEAAESSQGELDCIKTAVAGRLVHFSGLFHEIDVMRSAESWLCAADAPEPSSSDVAPAILIPGRDVENARRVSGVAVVRTCSTFRCRLVDLVAQVDG